MALQVGMKIFVDVTSENIKGDVIETFALTSVVEELPDVNTVIIQMPMHQGHFYSFSSFSSVYIRFATRTSFFAFEAKYQGSINRGPLTLARFERLSGFEERQFRDCFRLPCFIPARVFLHWESEMDDEEYKAFRESPPEPLLGHLLDLSDGGALVAANVELERGAKITLNFDLGFKVTVECVALRSIQSLNKNYKTNYGVSFSNLPPKEGERIYGYLVREQQKKKGKA